MGDLTALDYSRMGRSVEAAAGLYSIQQEANVADAQAGLIDLQMENMKINHTINLDSVRGRADKVVAEQAAAFISAGVEMEGSPMSVVSDTMNDAAKEAFILQREHSSRMESAARDKAYYESQASTESMLLKTAALSFNAYAGMKTDEYKYNKANTKNRGASGIG